MAPKTPFVLLPPARLWWRGGPPFFVFHPRHTTVRTSPSQICIRRKKERRRGRGFLFSPLLREKRILPWEREREKGASLKRPLVSSPRREKDPSFVHVWGGEREGSNGRKLVWPGGRKREGKRLFQLLDAASSPPPPPKRPQTGKGKEKTGGGEIERRRTRLELGKWPSPLPPPSSDLLSPSILPWVAFGWRRRRKRRKRRICLAGEGGSGRS